MKVISINNFISSSGSDFLTSYGSVTGSTRQKVTVPTVPVPVSGSTTLVYHSVSDQIQNPTKLPYHPGTKT